MAKMSNDEVVKAFLKQRNAESHTGSLTSAYGKLFSYGTCISQWAGGFLYINATTYSMTTSCKHQSPLFRQVNDLYRNINDADKNIIYVAHVPMWHKELTDCV